MNNSLAYHYIGFLTVATLSATAGNWPQWRGPHFNGSADEKDLPSTWSKETALWSVDLPGPSAATPVVWGDHVYVSTTDNTSRTVNAVCVDRKTGKIVWNNKTGDGIGRGDNSNFA